MFLVFKKNRRTNLPRFDAQAFLSSDLDVFGPLGSGPLIGQIAKFSGHLPEHDIDLTRVGGVVGHFHGRIVIGFETSYGVVYLGWLEPDQFEIVSDRYFENNQWIH